MSLRSFAPLAVAVAAFSFSGCDIFEEVQPTPSVDIPLTEIRLVDVPLEFNPRTPWDDDGTGPDIFVEIQNSAGIDVARSEVVADVDLTQPLTVTIPDAGEAGSETLSLFIVVFDDDGDGPLGATRMTSSEGFSVELLETAGQTLLLEDISAQQGRLTTYELVK